MMLPDDVAELSAAAMALVVEMVVSPIVWSRDAKVAAAVDRVLAARQALKGQG